MLYKTNEINCNAACRNIYRVAKEDLAVLAAYNVTTKIIDDFKTKIHDFSNIFSITMHYVNIKKCLQPR